LKRCDSSLWVSGAADARSRRDSGGSGAYMTGGRASSHASSAAESFANAMAAYAAARILICA
jgi:hypothetical protein